MAEGPDGLACVYCGGRHSSVAEVRACWSAGGRRDAPLTESAAPTTHHPSLAAPSLPGTDGAVSPAAGLILGRSVLVRPGQQPPTEWIGLDVVPGGADRLEELEEAWRNRRPLIIEAEDLPSDDETEQAPVWSLSPEFAFAGERLAHAATANAVDVRSGRLRWRWAERAVGLGAQPLGAPAGLVAADAPVPTPAALAPAGDVVLPDGRLAWCDGGPTGWLDPTGQVVVPRVSLLAGSLLPLGPNDTSAALAPDQLAAVTHPGGAARIIAPAGSGKTRVLTERARHLLRSWGLPGSALTLVAYNKRAANEMRQRTADLPELEIRTLNALGLAIAGGTRRLATIEEREVRSILDSLVDLPRRANTDPAAAWIEALSAVRLGLANPRAVAAEFDGDVDGLPEVFDRYRRVLADRGALDFDEQIYRAIEILLTDPDARRAARSSCALLLVDEFQDLTPAHLLLIRLLSGPAGEVFGVGDDDQTIYGYSGASPRWLIDYRRFFPSAGEHPLQVNYRCPVPVVAAARSLLSHNRQRVGKTIEPAPGARDGADTLKVVRDGEPLIATVDAVAELTGGGTPASDIAVLTRVNASLAPVQVALAHSGIPVRPAVGVAYLERAGVRSALAWLRLATARESALAGGDIALAARRPSRGLSPKLAEWMSEQRSLQGLERLAGRLSARERDVDKVEGFVSDLRLVRQTARTGSTADVLRCVRDGVGLDSAMRLLEGSRRRPDRSAQTDDLDALAAVASLHPDPAGFEVWLRRWLSEPGDEGGVVLATIHSVKGQEWPHVVVHDVSLGLLPHRLAADVEEERRVFHVAITRGSASVTVVAAGDGPSPFIREMFVAWKPSDRPPPFRLQPGRPQSVTSPPAAAPKSAKPAKPAKPGGSLSTHPAEAVDAARERLRAWRLAKSRDIGKPAYVIFSDATLDEIAARLPASATALSRVKGIGPAKLDSYGEEILAVVDAGDDKRY